MKNFIAGLIIGLILIPLGVYVYFVTGMAPVATSAQAMPFEKTLANKALKAHVEKNMPTSVPIAANDDTYIAGAKVYAGNCAVCHGLPNQPLTPAAKGMFPKPPQLFMHKGVTDDPPGETYWKVANGIRLTGMPAFSQSLSETQMWQVTLLLANADKIGNDVKQLLVPEVIQIGGAQPAASSPASTQKGTSK